MDVDVSKQGSFDVGGRRLRRGTNQSDMRDHNERLVLSLVREQGPLAKSDIARLTGLTLQTVSVIMRELEQTSLLVRQSPVRGKVGQPSVPMALNPDGAFFFGLKIGRRSSELVLIDFLGTVRSMLSQSYRYPTPGDTVRFAANSIQAMRAGLPAEVRGRVAGLGIAIPFELWNWVDAAGAPASVMDDWRDRDIRADLQARCEFPVYLQNDATSACGAELAFGGARGLRDFVYFYIGAFAGGGVVLNGRLFSGMTGNAGALGSMPVPSSNGKPAQLIDRASIAMLEKALIRRGIDASHLWTSPQNWGELGEDVDIWIADAGEALAYAIASACAVIDFEVAIVDGWMPTEIRARLVAAIRDALTRVDVEGLSLPEVREGTVGIHARALGGASLPLSARYLVAISR
ncbi:ROK family transcriptional regulator [Labrys okinawensis]|uniref:ROK family transcriptional regulator n=1 Tax=Labrys okinawensis TaxID=346911 RepID=UPI0039BCCEF7